MPTSSTDDSPSKYFSTSSMRGAGGHTPPVSNSDGGWSSGIPEKGSGWRASTTTGSGDCGWDSRSTDLGSGGSGGTSGWGDELNASSSTMGSGGDGKSGSNWVSTDADRSDGDGVSAISATTIKCNRSPASSSSSNRTDGGHSSTSGGGGGSGGNGNSGGGGGGGSGSGWRSKSPRQERPPYDKGAWGSSEGRENGGHTQSPVASLELRNGDNIISNGISAWGLKNVAGSEERNQGNDRRSDGSCLPQMEGVGIDTIGRGRPKGDVEWEQSDRLSIMGNEQGAATPGYSSHTHSQENCRPVANSPAVFGYPDNVSVGSSNGSNNGRGDIQLSGNYSNSHDSHVTGSDDMESHGFESLHSHISPRDGAGTPIQNHSGGAVTPTKNGGGGAKTEGGGFSENYWRAGRMNVGSTSSVSSVGNNSSWKSESKNGGGGIYQQQNRTNSPRKMNR